MEGNIYQAIAVIIALAIGVERAVEIVKKWARYDGYAPMYQEAIDLTLAFALGLVAAFLWNVDAFAAFFPDAPEYARLILTALAASAGSGFWHEILAVLQALKPQAKG